MNWQIPIVIIIVAVCGYYAFREITRQLAGKCQCPGCPGSNESSKPVQIRPMKNRE